MGLSDEATQWRDACRRAVARQRQFLEVHGSPTADDRVAIGASGDVTLAIDGAFEAIALEELDRLTSGQHMLVVSEECGEMGPASDAATGWVILDPIDGSTNIANSLPQFSLSVAVASGATMADVWFGFVFDFGANEEFVCERGRGVEVNSEPVTEASEGAHRLLGCESAEPRLLALALDRVAEAGVKEIRVVGSIAIALCYVALGRLDGLLTCRECRSVDAAAGQLIAASLGSSILFDGSPVEAAGLGLTERYRLVAGRADIIADLVEAQGLIPLVPR